MTKLIMHEIDGTDTCILAEPSDEYFAMLEPEAKEKCFEKGIHLYKGEDGIHYLADKDMVILASGMTTIRTYIRFLL